MPGHVMESARGTGISFALHVMAAWGAILATDQPPPPPAAPRPDTVVIYHGPPLTESVTMPPGPFHALFVTDLPPAPITIGPVLPVTMQPWIVDSSLTHRLALGGIDASGSEAPINPAGAPFAESAVDERPELISAYRPVFPDLLRQAGIEGTVVIEAVVDTSGRAERGSIRVHHSTNRAFENAAVEAVAKSRYRPGRVGDRPVRVLVQVPITFSIR